MGGGSSKHDLVDVPNPHQSYYMPLDRYQGNTFNPYMQDTNYAEQKSGNTNQKIDYPPYVMMGPHYNQQLVAQQQYAFGYPPRGAINAVQQGDYARQIQEYYQNLYASMGIPGYPQYPQYPQYPSYTMKPSHYEPARGPYGPTNGMTMGGGRPIGDGTMMMYETDDPYDDPSQKPHWHRRNRPDSGYAINIVRMNPGGTLQERPNVI